MSLEFYKFWCCLSQFLAINVDKLSLGRLAQLVEHLVYTERVIGSSPLPPTICGGVAQLVRAPACHAGGRGFEPHHSRQFPHVFKVVNNLFVSISPL